MNKLIIITAPSGSGKTTIVKHLIEHYPQLSFSVSACTREPRNGEKDGVDYHFLKESDFIKKINEDAFLEWEMVYPGKYYGTLKTEIEKIWQKGQTPLIDIDVKGALNIKNRFPQNTITLFLKAPSKKILKERLLKRGSETEESIQERLDKAAFELSFEQKFDYVVVNDELDKAINEIAHFINNFVNY